MPSPTLTKSGIEIEQITVQRVEMPEGTMWFGSARYWVNTEEGVRYRARLEGEIPANIRQLGIDFYQAIEALCLSQEGL